MTADNQNNKVRQIADKAKDIFIRYGFKSVTMDDISRELGISKKTLYQYFDNKLDLILNCVAFMIEEEKDFITQQKATSSDAIEEMMGIAAHVNQTLKKVNPAAIYDLQKYYAKAWQTLELYVNQFIFHSIKNNLEKGMETGVYRNDFRPDIIAKLFIGKARLILNNDVFPYSEYKTSELHTVHVMYHIRGVASPKGLEILEKHLK